MTFDDDYVRLPTPNGIRNLRCKLLGIDWPPPEQLVVNEQLYELRRHSAITDADREKMTNVCRGAEYVWKGAVTAEVDVVKH